MHRVKKNLKVSLENTIHKTFVIIVAYNGMPWIQKCLDSCQGYPVVVVDNNSTDGTVGFIKKNFPKTKVFPQHKNLGFGQANNIGMRYALDDGADYVFLLNQDAYLQEGCLERLVAVHKKNSEYGVLSPVHFNGSGSTLDSNFMLFLNRYMVAATILSDTFKQAINGLYPIEFVNAAAWLVSRECLETVGGFDPLFFHYGEDRNYCQRVAYYKFKIGIVPTASIYHDREDRVERKLEKYSHAYYREFERYLKVTNFDKKYSARTNYLRSKQRRFLLNFQFRKAKDTQVKRKIMLQLKTAIEKSRLSAVAGQMANI
jgi:GT2 family glycosyltransferase